MTDSLDQRANCGHFPWEIDVKSLKAQASVVANVDDTIEPIEFSGGRHAIRIANGRMVNLA